MPEPEKGPDRRRQARGRLKIAGDALFRTLRFIARHVEGFWAALAAYLSVGLVAGILAVWVFVALGQVVLGGATQAFDDGVLRWLAAYRTPVLDNIALQVTSLGNTAVLIMVLAIASVFLYLSRHRYSAYLLWIAVVGEKLINALLKNAYGRPRPSVVTHETQVVSLSFPSGHAMSAVVVYGAMAYLIGRLAPSRRLRRATWTTAVFVIVLVGLSRIYLGVHYPSDVIGGFLAGFAWVAILASVLTALKFFAPRKPEIEVEERDLHAEEERAAGARE